MASTKQAVSFGAEGQDAAVRCAIKRQLRNDKHLGETGRRNLEAALAQLQPPSWDIEELF